LWVVTGERFWPRFARSGGVGNEYQTVFDVQIADEDAERMRTIGYVLQYLDKVNAGG
jgi:hypothetical protein